MSDKHKKLLTITFLVINYNQKGEIKMETQDLIILHHLKKHRSITSWEAIEKYRITRLSARIFNLRGKGYDIITRYETNEVTGTRYARYVLLRSKDWSEADLFELPKEKFTGKFAVSDEEYDMLVKATQEM